MPSGRRHYRLALADALSAHELALLSRGGRAGILNLGLIESAIQRPYSGYYRSIHRKAAALVHSAARNHGFADGNKRTSLLLLMLLLKRSGYELADDGSPATNDAVEAMIVSVAEGLMTFGAAAAATATVKVIAEAEVPEATTAVVLQVTTCPAAAQVQPAPDAETKLRPAGKVSSTVMVPAVGAAEGPLLVLLRDSV